MDGLGQKAGGPSPSVLLDRFRETIKEKEEEFGVVDGDEIVALYEDFLEELILNSKPIITELTIIAGEQRQHARGIAEAICSRIIEVPVEKKLPSLYLLDSIVKNIGTEYVRCFAARIPEVFCEAYNHVNPNLRPSMRHLFGTWSQVFPSPVLEKIENELQFSSHGIKQSFSALSTRQSESQHPGHSIHINPKYLESQQQFEQSTKDTRRQRGISSRMDLHEDSEFDNPRIMNSLNSAPRNGILQGTTGRASTSRNETLRPSASSAALRMRNRNGRWEKDFPPFDDFEQLETIRTHNPSEEYRKRRPRELIDAYGNNRGGNIQSERSSKIRRRDNNLGINAEEPTRSWQNTEEEEYVWEDMRKTSVSQNKGDKRIPYTADSGSFGMGSSMRRLPTSLLDSDFRTSIRAPLLSDDATPMFDDRNPILASTSRSMRPHSRRDLSHYQNSPYTEPRNSQYPPSQSSQQSLSPRLHGRMPLSANGVPILGVFSSGPKDNPVVPKPSSPPTVWPPPVHKSQALPPFLPNQQDFRNPLNSSSVNQGSVQSFSMPWRSSDVTDRTSFNSSMPIQIPHQSSGSIHFNRQNHDQNSAMRFQHHDPHGRMIHSASPQLPSHFVGQSLHHGASIENQHMHRVHGNSFHAHGSLPPQPPGPPPPSSIVPHNLGSNEKISGLIDSLVSQGFISVHSTALSKDSIGLEFDLELLKVRHEHVINDLYDKLPRQCKTCGMRFKCQEEHSTHMDWHVTKNRMSKMRKQKPSRKWFVSGKEWLSGAEAVGTDVSPGFLPTEAVVDKTEEKELAVPADENQNTCALCGDVFEDFYSDEADEWMYRGAVYMNAPGEPIEGMDISQLGPIVHAKCMSESSEGQKQS